MKNKDIILNGIIKENPTFVLVLGTCPTLAVTTQAMNGLSMGLATMAVLICSNVAISLLRNIIPDKVRIPCYIVFISGFVIIVGLLMEALVPTLYDALGLFLSLIVVNCIILGRAEMFASKNKPSAAALDGIGMGLGFTMALILIGSIREIFGSGTWFGLQILPTGMSPIAILMLAPGGFFVYGCMIALANYFIRKKGGTPVDKSNGCASCACFGACHGADAEKGGCCQ